MAGGVNLNARDKHGDTALMLASNNGSVEITEMLIKAEAKLDLQNIHGDTALMRASNNGHTEIAKMLIKAEAKLDLQNKDGATALMVASDNGHREIVELLIKAGADVSIKDQYGKTARDYAISEGHKDIAELLHSYEQKSAESQRKWWQSVAQDIVVALLAVGAVSGVAIGLDALCKSWQEKQARKRFTNAIDAQKSQLDAELSLIFSERGVITHNETVPLRASFTVTPERSRAMRDAISALWTEETITHIAAQISNEGHSAQLFLKTAGSLGRVYAQFQQDYIAPRIRTLWHESTEYKRLVEAKGYLAKTLTCSVEEDKKSLEDRLRKIAGELDTAQIHRAGLNACDNDKSDKRVETAIRENGVKKAVFEKDIIAGLTQKKDDFIAQLDAQEGYRNRCKKDSVILANAEDIIALKNQQSSGDITEALKNLGSVLENLRAMNKDLGEKVTTAQNHDTKNKQKHAAAKADMEKKLAPQREAEEQRIDEAMARMAELELAITRKMRENEQRWEKEALMPEEERKTPSPEPRAIVQRVAPEEVRNHERVRSADSSFALLRSRLENNSSHKDDILLSLGQTLEALSHCPKSFGINNLLPVAQARYIRDCIFHGFKRLADKEAREMAQELLPELQKTITALTTTGEIPPSERLFAAKLISKKLYSMDAINGSGSARDYLGNIQEVLKSKPTDLSMVYIGNNVKALKEKYADSYEQLDPRLKSFTDIRNAYAHGGSLDERQQSRSRDLKAAYGAMLGTVNSDLAQPQLWQHKQSTGRAEGRGSAIEIGHRISK